MRINQNVMANNASRNLAGTNAMLGKSMEKLSSGFRINRAADDAAGLVISQGLRAQVSGLKQATRNAQDAISVVQTAEGALNEVHTMLTRMRDLAVQAANTGGNDAASRTAAQSEISQLATEITRVSVDTKFGGTSLLDGSYGATAGKLSSFDPNGSLTFAAGNTINVNVTGGSGAVSVSLSAGTFTGSAAAASIESSVKAALYATGNATDKAAADGFKSTFDAVGAGGAFTFANSSTAAIAVTDGTGTPLLAAANGLGGLVGTVAAATGTGGNFQIGANSGQLVSVSITSTSAATLGVNALVVTTDAGAAAALTSLDTEAIAESSDVSAAAAPTSVVTTSALTPRVAALVLVIETDTC
jgi:flagellin